MLRSLMQGAKRMPVSWLRLHPNQCLPSQSTHARYHFSTTTRDIRLAKESSGSDSAKSDDPGDLSEYRKPSNFQKKILVWGKMYKSVGDVPDRVSALKVKKSQDMFRVRVCLLMMAATVVACVIEVIRGKRMRDSGDSLSARGNAQIEEWKQLGERERENKKELAEFKRNGGGKS